MSDDVVILAEGLSKSFGDFLVVRDLDLTVRRGQIYGFLGPNGSGKTTTMRMLVGLLEPDSGRGECLGMDILKRRDEIRGKVGYMTQKFSLYTDLSVEENLEFVAKIYGLSGARKKVRSTIEELGLGGREDQLVGTLSGGWKQRLALAAAIMHEPELLLLDEPTAGVDPMARRDFWDRIYDLASEGLTVLVSTHYMDEAERCHEIAYLAYGKLLAAGKAKEVIEDTGLLVWEVAGGPERLARLSQAVREREGVLTAVPFGTRLRIAGVDSDKLDEATREEREEEDLEWERTEASLEDVFLYLLQEANDDRAQRGRKEGG